MAISFVDAIAQSNASPAPGTTMSLSTMPTHQAGDLLLFFSASTGYTSSPLPPASSGIVVLLVTGQSTTGLTIAYKIAASSSEVSGTWTVSPTHLGCAVYRSNTGIVLPGGTVSIGSDSVGSGGNVTFQALPDRSQGNTEKWFAGLIAHRQNNTTIEVAPSGMVNRASVAGASLGEIAMHDTNSSVSSWSAANVTLTAGTAGAYRSCTLELVESSISTGGGNIIVIED